MGSTPLPAAGETAALRACKAEACAIQTCLAAHSSQESRCVAERGAWERCAKNAALRSDTAGAASSRGVRAAKSSLINTLCALSVMSASTQYVPAELADMTLCTQSGLGSSFSDLRPYMQRLDLTSPYGKSTSAPLFMPLFSSHNLSLTQVDPSVTTLAIYLHGLSATAQSYFCTGVAASRGRHTLVVSPWHGNEQQNSSYWCSGFGSGACDAGSFSAYWTSSRWLTGGNISPGLTGAAQYTTSFDIMDALIANLTASLLFPNLRQVSLLGFSAGSQFFSRYAWGSPVGAIASASNGVPVRYIISDPGTYLYLSPERPGSDCRPLYNTGVSPVCLNWTTPSPSELVDCPDYNQYKFGISPGLFANLNAYMAPYDIDATLRDAATARFGKKSIYFILGEEDACNCNFAGFANSQYCFPQGKSLDCLPNENGGTGCCDTWPDATTSNAMDTGCEAMLQGSQRLQRGLLYVQHLNRVFLARAMGPFPHFTVKGMGHNNSAEYASAPFMELAFYSPPPAQAAASPVSVVAIAGGVGVTACAAVITALTFLRMRARKTSAGETERLL